ncbi:MAG: M17 family peptidase N-terminal domain-containing protein, partial [Pseudomonadota bacterium]
MQFTTRSDSITDLASDALIIGVAMGQAFDSHLGQINDATNGLLQQLDLNGELPRKAGKTLLLHHPAGLQVGRLIVVGLGKTDKLDGITFVKAAQAVGKALRQSQARNAHCLLSETEVQGRDAAWVVRQTALALTHSNYIYAATKKAADDAAPATDNVSFPAAEGVDAQLSIAAALGAGIQTARDLGDLPPNVCTPVYLAELATKLADEIEGLEVEILDEDQMAELGMNSLLAVGQGSVNPSRLIRLRWQGGQADEAPLAMVGKGVTFDTGGISLKPRELMEQMKFDMCGAAATIGAVEAAARLKLPINVDGVVGAV